MITALCFRRGRRANASGKSDDATLQQDRDGRRSASHSTVRSQAHNGDSLLTAGVHPKVVQERLGHSTSKLTLDTYSHVMPSMQQGATESSERIMNA